MPERTIESTTRLSAGFGPVLFLRAVAEDRVSLVAIVCRRQDTSPGALTTAAGRTEPEPLATRLGLTLHRYAFDLPIAERAWYEVEGRRFEVATDMTGDMRVAFVSCNGKEDGDFARDPSERNLMWARLADENDERPFHVMLHGGDQIYADETKLAHPLTEGWPFDIPKAFPDQAGELGEALRDAFFERYTAVYAQAPFARIAARVPSLTIWDDHDICDGWGSLPASKLDSVQGQAILSAARESYLMFQFGAAPGRLPRICADPEGQTLGWRIDLPDLHVVTPDLRSERRPQRVMDGKGWTMFEAAMAETSAARTFVISSVPALGPRLSLVERWMQMTPWTEDYQDDLRDQWQSRAHRAEWRRFLRAMLGAHHNGTEVTVLSGEIHLATRGTLADGGRDIHQLVASGITHPAPPKLYAAALGLLASFGEAPLEEHPISLHPLPGKRRIYTAERNYLVLHRTAGAWQASWRLEHSGATPWLDI